jgi:UDP-sulfoquinovose synthase
LGVTSLVSIAPLERRVSVWREVSGCQITTFVGDLTDPVFAKGTIAGFCPDTIVHFAEQRSAPTR